MICACSHVEILALSAAHQDYLFANLREPTMSIVSIEVLLWDTLEVHLYQVYKRRIVPC